MTTAFTRNYTDHSNPQGYQFEFHCDKCGSGFRSTFAANKLGVASEMLNAAGQLFGGVLGRAASAGNQLKDAFRGKAWDDAFAAAIEEIKPKFRQCTRCGRWLCPEVCWNPKAALCKECAPDLVEETASAQAKAMGAAAAQQIADKVAKQDFTGGVDPRAQTAAACPHCAARLEGPAKFCGSCGKPIAAGPSPCPKCSAPIPAASKFCPECGAPRA
jgi:membrane protease subunit (stomatin/prohibitin family)